MLPRLTLIEKMSSRKSDRNAPVNKTEAKATPMLKNAKVTKESSTQKAPSVMSGSRQSKAMQKLEKARTIAAPAYKKQGIPENRKTPEPGTAVRQTKSTVSKTGSVELRDNLKNHQIKYIKQPDQKQIALRKIIGKLMHQP